MTRKTETRKFWETELEYILETYRNKDFKNFNYSLETFGNYCNMQSKFCAEDGFQDLADSIPYIHNH